MSNIVFYDPNGIVTNRVINYLKSVNTPDYESSPNILINPDISLVLNVPTNYWKVVSDNVEEMSENEKNMLDDFLNAKTFRQNKYQISSYDDFHRLSKITFYDTDNGDGTYSGKVNETTFEYFENSSVILHKKVVIFYFDGSISSTDNYDYYKNDKNEIIEKKV